MSRWEGFEELVEVVNSGSFSAAARVLGVSKGHVSQQISRLEDRLNTRLLHRTTRKLSLTETGEVYYQQCSQVVEDLESAERAITTLQAEAKGPLKISAPHLIGEILLVPAISEFQKNNPQLEIDLHLTSHRVDLIEDHFDIAIQVGKREDVNVVAKTLAPTNFHVVSSPEYLKSHGVPVKPADLKQHNCLLFVDGGVSKPWRFRGSKGTVSVSVKSNWRSNSGHVLRSAAVRGLGLAYLPDYYLRDDLTNGRLVTILNNWQTIDRDIVAVYQHRRHLSAKIRLFTEFLAQYFENEIQSLQLLGS